MLVEHDYVDKLKVVVCHVFDIEYSNVFYMGAIINLENCRPRILLVCKKSQFSNN